jgi:hypothetical protein
MIFIIFSLFCQFSLFLNIYICCQDVRYDSSRSNQNHHARMFFFMLGLCKGFLEVSLSCTHSMHKWDDFLVMALSLCRFVYFVIGLHSSGFNIVGCRRNAVVQPWLTGFAVFRNRQCVRRCGSLVGIGAPAWEMCAKTSRSIKCFFIYQ